MTLSIFLSAASDDFGNRSSPGEPSIRERLAKRIKNLEAAHEGMAARIDVPIEVDHQDNLKPLDSVTVGNLIEAIRASNLVIHVIGPNPGKVADGTEHLDALAPLDRTSRYAAHIWAGLEACTYTQFEARIALLLGIKLLVFDFRMDDDHASEHTPGRKSTDEHLKFLRTIPGFHHYPLRWRPSAKTNEPITRNKAVDCLGDAICTAIENFTKRPKQEEWRRRRLELLTIDAAASRGLRRDQTFDRPKLCELILGDADSEETTHLRLFRANACSGKSTAMTWATNNPPWKSQIVALYRCSESSTSTRRLGYFVQSIAAQLQRYVRGPDLNFSELTAGQLSNERMRSFTGQPVDPALAEQTLLQVFKEILPNVGDSSTANQVPHFETDDPNTELPKGAIIVVDGADELLGSASSAGAALLKFIWRFPWPNQVRVVVTAQPSLELPAVNESGANKWELLDFSRLDADDQRLTALRGEVREVSDQIVFKAFKD